MYMNPTVKIYTFCRPPGSFYNKIIDFVYHDRILLYSWLAHHHIFQMHDVFVVGKQDFRRSLDHSNF
ncbi:unnamed protein product [Schistosoma curassoni]|uniref:Sulfotransfer_1 domain-containing protein n=1 Tax=Schistosoma curassoni TaxID=6186 RepID=A0A183JZ82_9TREM|nr:unnamed protein product [Schistosoma curassoni]